MNTDNIPSETKDQHWPRHISLFYDSIEQRLRYLSDYFTAGTERNELCVLITHHLTPGLAGHPLALSTSETYLTKGQFVVERMLANLVGSISDAHARGNIGLRIAGDMDWLTTLPAAQDDVANYESQINTLGTNEDFICLCLYPVDTSLAQAIKNAVRTHPELAYDEESYRNPYYFRPKDFESFKTNSLGANVELWLDNTDQLKDFKQLHSVEHAINKLMLSVGGTAPRG